MTNLLILMILYLTYMVISFWLFNQNFLSPSFVFSLSMSLMLCLAYYAGENLGMLMAINLETFSIFGFAGFLFLATEFLVYSMNTVKVLKRNPSQQLKIQPLIVDSRIQYAFTIFLAMSAVIVLAVIFMNTGGSWHNRMSTHRENMIYYPERIRGRFLIAQLYKINYSAISFFTYVLVYNLTICSMPVKKVWLYVVDVLIFAVFSSLYAGGRQPAIETMLYVMMIYVLLNMRPGGRRKIYRFIGKMIPILVLVASLFTAVGPMLGRYDSGKSSILNFAEYICGGLYAFNLHIDDGASTQYFGQFSLSHIYSVLNNAGLLPSDVTIMTYAGFELYGTTLTIFGRWHRDFGVVGVFVITILVSMLYSLLFYGKIVYSSNLRKEHHLARIFYCQVLTALIWAGYDDRVGALLTTQTITSLLLTAILYKLVLKVKE